MKNPNYSFSIKLIILLIPKISGIDMKIIADLSITPIGVEISLSKYIVACERILKDQGLYIKVHAEGTNIEGDLNDVLNGIRLCIDTLHKEGVPRLKTHISISSRIDKIENIDAKINSIEIQI